MKAKLVLLHWEDAITPTDGWTDITELKSELANCVSVGFVVEETDKLISIVSHISGDEDGTDIDGSLVVDKAWIKERQDLSLSFTPDKDIAELVGKWLDGSLIVDKAKDKLKRGKDAKKS
jgi:hypothetical protein